MQMLDTIPEAIEAVRNGEVIIVVDDEDRENEGDFLVAARHAARGRQLHGHSRTRIDLRAFGGRAVRRARFTIDGPIQQRCIRDALHRERRPDRPRVHHGHLSARPLQDHPSAHQFQHAAEELGKPGHIFPLRARKGGVLRRAGHTEAAIDFARLAGFEPAGVIVEIMNEDGTMARLPQCRELADKFNLKLVSIADLIEHRLQNETLIERVKEMEIQTAFGPFKAVVFRQSSNEVEHVALVKGTWEENDEVPVRVHSSSMLGDVFQITDFGKGPMLHAAMKKMDEIGCGVLVYLNKLRPRRGHPR